MGWCSPNLSTPWSATSSGAIPRSLNEGPYSKSCEHPHRLAGERELYYRCFVLDIIGLSLFVVTRASLLKMKARKSGSSRFVVQMRR